MKLLPIPGYPGYRIDILNHKVYSLKFGELRLLNVHKPYNEICLYRNGETYRHTLPRLEYCTAKGIDPLDLPKGTCIIWENGNAKVVDRCVLAQKTANTKKKEGQTIDELKSVLFAAEAWVQGDEKPYTMMVMEQSYKAKETFISRYHRAETVIEEAVDAAVSSILDKMKDGIVTNNPRKFITSYIHSYISSMRMKRREYRDNMQPIIVEE